MSALQLRSHVQRASHRDDGPRFGEAVSANHDVVVTHVIDRFLEAKERLSHAQIHATKTNYQIKNRKLVEEENFRFRQIIQGSILRYRSSSQASTEKDCPKSSPSSSMDLP